MNITVLPSPIAKFEISSPRCEKNNITIFDSSLANVGKIISWNWNFGNNDSIVLNNNLSFQYLYNTANNYTVKLKITTDSGCTNSNNISIKINYIPKVNFGIPSICLPNGNGKFIDSTTITDNSNDFKYKWSFGDKNDTTTSNLQNPIHRYSDTNSANVKLIVTSKFGCTDSLTRKLTAIYPQPKVKFSITPDTSICFGDKLFYTDSSNGVSSSIKQWVWDLGFGYTSSQQNPSQTYNDSGTTIVSLFIYNKQNCVSDTFYKTIIVNPYPIIQLPSTLTFLQGGLLTIKPIYYYGKDLSYLWTPKVYLVNDTVLNAQVFPIGDKRYFLTITGAGNCSDTASVNVIALKLPKIPNVFSPNNDGINDFWVIEHLESYPGCSVQVFDRYGRQVYISLGYSKNWDGKSNGAPLPTGTYYYIVNPKNGTEKLSGSVTILR
jgi:gliding motility-associated-like protein